MPGIISPTADFSASGLGRALQLTTNRASLVGEFLFGRNLATSRINSAGLKVPASEALVGAPAVPVYGDHQMEVGNGAGLDTLVAATDAMTCMVICTGETAGTQILLGADSAAAARFNLLTVGTSANLTVAGGNPAAVVLPGALTGNTTDFRALVMRISGVAAGAALAIDEYRGGVRTQGAKSALTATVARGAYTRVVGNSSTIGANAGYTARNRFAAYLHWSAYLSDDAVLAAYAELRAVLAPMGKAI